MDPDAVKLFNQMCVEFVCLLTSEANELMEKSKRKTIMAEHMQEALKGLGFGDYVVEAAEAVRVALGLSKVGLFFPLCYRGTYVCANQ